MNNLPNYLKVSDHEGLIRDTNKNSIINTNKTAYEEYLTKRNIKKKNTEKIIQLENEIKDIKSDINDIKNLLIDALKNK